MGRTAIMTIALAALAVYAHGAPATPAHAHRKAAGSQAARHTTTSQVLTHERSSRSAAHPHEKATTLHHPARTTRRPSAPSSRSRLQAAHPEDEAALHKPTPEEVGRAAGLRIRAQMAAGRRSRNQFAAGRRTHNSMDRRTVLRHSARYRRQPELVRARYTPARVEHPIEAAYEERPEARPESESQPEQYRQPESESFSGTTNYEAVGDEPGALPSARTDVDRRDPADASETSPSESASAVPKTAASVQTTRRYAAARPATTMVASVDTESSNTSLSDSDPSASFPSAAPNAAHPSFERHAAVPIPETAPAFSNRAPAKQLLGENANALDNSEDTRLKAETEEASLSIARGYMPAPLYGNRASLERQNDRLEAEGLERIEDEDDLAERIAHHLLVPVPVSDALSINANLPVNHRYCRPWTARFLSDLAAAHEAKFHRPLEVSSAVRTVEYQKKLMQVNGNAAPAEGDIVSPHLTGATIDIAKDNMSRAEMAWMRRYLLTIEAEGKIDVEEEFQQACFHIAVYKDYLPTYHGTPHRSLTPSQAHTGGARHHSAPTPVADGVSAQGI